MGVWGGVVTALTMGLLLSTPIIVYAGTDSMELAALSFAIAVVAASCFVCWWALGSVFCKEDEKCDDSYDLAIRQT